jgi:alpha-1,6-mannosyltransferase
MRRLALLGFISLLLYMLGHIWQPPLDRSYYPVYCLWFSLLFVIYVAALIESRRLSAAALPAVVPLIVGWALVFRLSLLWVTPGFLSDDIYRYVWDGLVQRAGINPYCYPPEAAELAFLRDTTIFPMINRQWAPTIYPPAAQAFFRLMAWISPGSLVAMKAVILLADAMAIALLLKLLGELGLDRATVLLYAWNPLVIVELGISGHLDGLMLLFVLLAFLCVFRKRLWWAGLALGMATLIKLYPAILLPVLWRRRGWPMPVACIMLIALGYGLYLGAGPQILGYLPLYMSEYEAYNLGLRAALTRLLGFVTADAFRAAQWLGSGGLLLVMLWCVMRGQKSPAETVHWGLGVIALYFLVVSPSVFQWYLLWLLALATLSQTWSTPAWLYWTWSVNLAYLETLRLSAASLFWLRLAEYAPIVLWLGIGWLWACSRQTRHGMYPQPFDTPRGAHP